MKVLSAIGRFFARIGRWIKETAWIQPLLIVGGIFAIIFAIPHVINGVKSWFSESDAANKFYAQYSLSLSGAEKGTSEVDKLFTNIYEGKKDEITKGKAENERFFLAFVQKNNSSAKDLYSGIKMFKDRFNSNAEFKGLDGKFTLKVIYTDTTNDDDENLFDMVWNNHYELFEEMSDSSFLPKTYYAINNEFGVEKYESNFLSTSSMDECPMSTPLMMYFDYSGSLTDPSNDYYNAEVNYNAVEGLSDVLFSVDGSSDLEKAYVLRDCWSHAKSFGSIDKR